MFKFIWLIRDRNEWKRRAESLELKLEKERIANRHYEREMVSRFITLQGAMGIPQEKTPTPKSTPAIPKPSEQAFKSLTPAQQEDLSMYLEDAEANGISPNKAWDDFYQQKILAHLHTGEELVDAEN